MTLLRLNNLGNWWVFGKRLPNNLKNFLPIFVETLRLNGGLNHIMFLFIFFVLFVTVVVFCCFWNVILCLNLLSANPLLYKSLDLLNVVSSADQVLILLDILPGTFLIIFWGWLESMLIYNELLFGLLQGWYLPVVRFRVISRKLTSFKLVSQVILKYYKIFSYYISLCSAGISKTS